MQIQMTIPDQKILDVVAASPEIQARIASVLNRDSATASAPTAKRSRQPAAVKPAIEPPPTKRPLAKGQPTASTKPRKKVDASTKGNKRDPEALAALEKEFVAYVKAHPGQPMEVIKKALSIKGNGLALPVKKALAAGTVRTEGNKRATRYFPTSAAA